MSQKIRRTVMAAATVAGSLLASGGPVQAAPSVNAKMCGVVEKGFTPFEYESHVGQFGASVGVAVRNRTKVDAVQVDLKVNAYSGDGTLLETQEFGLQNVPARQTVVDGYDILTTAPVASIKVMITCDKPLSTAKKDRLPRFQKATGTWAANTDDPYGPPSTVAGTFVNRQKTGYFYNVFYVVRNAAGRIVGGGFTNTLGTVPRGGDVRWDVGSPVADFGGPVTVQANTSSTYNAI